jgi:hypothetical protein
MIKGPSSSVDLRMANLLENKDGNYHLRKKIKPKHRGE